MNAKPKSITELRTAMTRMESRPRFRIELQAEMNESDPSGIIRLRRALKVLLRSFGLRCVKAVQLSTDGDTSTLEQLSTMNKGSQ